MSKQLIERLRELSANRKPYATGAHGQVIGMESYRIVANGFALECIDEAADLIERQAAQIEGLNEQVAELERAKEYKYVEQVLRPIKILIALAQSAETLAENSEETENSSGKIALGMPSDFETLSENLDLLDELPDDKPGYTLSGAAKAAWALRDLLGENYD